MKKSILTAAMVFFTALTASAQYKISFTPTDTTKLSYSVWGIKQDTMSEEQTTCSCQIQKGEIKFIYCSRTRVAISYNENGTAYFLTEDVPQYFVIGKGPIETVDQKQFRLEVKKEYEEMKEK